jgi:REP element-mobilizing transposase RayT
MNELKYEYRRKLPHIYPIGAKFFITFCLKGSMPYEIAEQYKKERDTKIDKLTKSGQNAIEEIYKEHKRYFAKTDQYLDNSTQKWILQRPEIAKIVTTKLHQLDKDLYDLIAYCVMSNHVHLVFNMDLQIENIPEYEILTAKNYVQIERIMQRIKGGSSYEINKFLDTQGTTNWQSESYDHYIRNDKELQNIISYTLQNPVKAGLVEKWHDWKFSYVNENYL